MRPIRLEVGAGAARSGPIPPTVLEVTFCRHDPAHHSAGRHPTPELVAGGLAHSPVPGTTSSSHLKGGARAEDALAGAHEPTSTGELGIWHPRLNLGLLDEAHALDLFLERPAERAGRP